MIMSKRDDRTREVHRFICQHWQRYGFTPTLRQIADHAGFSSNGGVLRHLDKLEKWRWIDRHHGHARTIRILKMCDEYSDACDDPNGDNPCLSPPPSRRK